MAEHSGKIDLTGVWTGLYSYQSGQSVPFSASLIETACSFSGGASESCVVGDGSRQTLFSTFSGRRRGLSLFFVKTYDGTAGWRHSVRYEGALDADAAEIEGRWTIPGSGLSGRFMMIRSRGTAEQVARRVEERA
ncbi:MAG: hypothetical protein ABWZ80_00920 [Beijerinckiaceae bacterium]